MGGDVLLPEIRSMTDSIDLDEYADSSKLKLGEDNILSFQIEIELPTHLEYNSALPQYGNDEDLPHVAQVEKKNQAPASSNTSQFTCRQLKTMPNWIEWRASECKQLDEMVRCKMFGKVVLQHEIKGDYDVIRIVWLYVVKLLTQKLKV